MSTSVKVSYAFWMKIFKNGFSTNSYFNLFKILEK